ncbi:MAG: class I SAM-dependent methyltransferase [Candidatus Auribacterota bacterium]|nr:class I SAM-dependent methyltransferase [Candidatus Auribacterota bacterium]
MQANKKKFLSESPSRAVEAFADYATKNHLSMEGSMLGTLCGNGANGTVFARMGINFFGIDPNLDLLKEFQEKAAGEKLSANIHLYNQEITKSFPFEDSFFDYILDISTSEMLVNEADFTSYASEITRVLKPNGHLMISYFSQDDALYKKFTKGSSSKIFFNKITGQKTRIFTPPDFREIYNLQLIPGFQTRIEYEETIGAKKYNRELFIMVMEKF